VFEVKPLISNHSTPHVNHRYQAMVACLIKWLWILL